MKKIATSHTAFFRLFFLCLLLIAGVNLLWGDVHLYDASIKASFNGSAWNNGEYYKMYGGGPNASLETAVNMGTLTGDFIVTDFSVKINTNYDTNRSQHVFWYNVDGAGGNNYIVNWGTSNGDGYPTANSIDYTVASYTDASGVHSLNIGFYSDFWWGEGDNDKDPRQELKTYYFTYAILPPNATSITATATGAISGSGSELDPYIVPYGGDLTIALSGSTKERRDDNSEVQYSTDGGSTYGTSDSDISKTFSNVTATTLQNYVFKARCFNSTASLESPSITTKTVYYKAARGVPVYKFVTKSSDLGTAAVCSVIDTDYPLTTSDALTTLLGGTLTARAAKDGTGHLSYNTSNLKFTGAKAWLNIGLENKIKAGDVIRYINSGTTSSKVSIRTAQSTSTNQIDLTGNGSTTIQTVVITDAQATAFASLDNIYMVRTAGNALISYFEILRPYTITLDANTNGGKIGGENTIKMYFAEDEPQTLPHATKSGYKFKGWYTTSDGNTSAANPYTATANTTLYAQWEDCPSSGSVYKFQVGTGLTNGSVTASNVAFDFNVGNYLSDLDGGTLSTDGSNAANVTIANNNCISIGNNKSYLQIDLDCATEVGDTIKTIVTDYTAWLHDSSTKTQTMTIATSANTSTYQKQVIPADLEDKSTLYMFRGSGTCNVLYFEIIRPQKYAITYDAGEDGSGSIDAGTKIYNGDFTLSSTTFSRDDFIQDGWATSDGGSKVYDLGGTYSTNADITLYPHWAHSVTYHSATEDDYSITVQHDDDIDDTYIPSNCAAADRVFVGWATSEVSTQQTAPTIVSTDGTLKDVSSNMDLYAVFASRNGGKVTGSHKLTEDFESYSTNTKYDKTGLTFDNANGLSWQIDYGNVTTSGASRFGALNTKNVILSINNSYSNKLITRSAVKDVLGISVLAGRATAKIYGVMYWGSSPSSLTNNKNLAIASNSGSYKTTQTFSTPQNIYVRFSSLELTTISSGDHLYLDSVVFTIADRAYYLTDYSTTCTKAASATVTWVGGEGAEYDEPSAPALGDWVTFPEITRPNYQFDGWKATIEGDEKSHTYNAGESFLVNHDVTFTAQWTRYIEDIDGVSPITTGNGIAVRSYEVDSIVVNSETATTPTVNKVGTDASMFTVTIDAANKRVADGKTHFPYYVTYTPTSHNITSSVDISFTCDGVESSAITVRGRSLPEEFVIAAKYADDGKWYALPNDIATSSGTVPVPIEVYVDNNSTPTKALVAKENLVYKTADRYEPKPNTQFVSLRLTPDGTNYLRAGKSDYSMWLTSLSSVNTNWYLSSSDLASYLVTQDPANAIDKRIGFYNSSGIKMGFHGTAPKGYTIYFLPIETKADYIDATVTSWAQYHIEVTLAAELDVDAVTAKLGATSDDATEITGSGTQYGITFDDLDLSGKSGEKLVLVWKKSSSTVGASIVTIPSIVAPDEEVSDWSDISATEDDIVVIKSDVTVDATDAVAKSVVLTDDHKLTIGANKALVVSGKITREDGSPTTAADLVIKSTSSGNGTLIFENAGNEATVEMYSIASTAGAKWTWQYIAAPVSGASVLTNYYDGYLYKWAWDETNSKYAWIAQGVSATTETFAGYCLSYPTAGHTFVIEGALATETSKDISVPAGKEMVVGNSWTAPIQIKQLRDADFSNLSKNVYLFNTGNDEGCSGTSGTRSEAGTYVTIPIHSSPYTGDSVISALQGFYVTNNTASEGTLHLSYADHVRPASGNSVVNGPMFAPQRTKTEQHPVVLKLWACGSRYEDKFVLLEHSDFSKDLDEGWDGEKWFGGEASPAIYTTRQDGTPDAVSAIPEMDGTVISFRKGEDSNYTLRFEYAEDNDELYIVDTKTQQTTRVLSGNTYTFTADDTEAHARFLLTRSNAPQITTGNANANANAEKATKLILNQQLYIYRNGILFDATGRRVDSFSVGSGFDANANANANAEQEKGGAE